MFIPIICQLDSKEWDIYIIHIEYLEGLFKKRVSYYKKHFADINSA